LSFCLFFCFFVNGLHRPRHAASNGVRRPEAFRRISERKRGTPAECDGSPVEYSNRGSHNSRADNSAATKPREHVMLINKAAVEIPIERPAPFFKPTVERDDSSLSFWSSFHCVCPAEHSATTTTTRG